MAYRNQCIKKTYATAIKTLLLVFLMHLLAPGSLQANELGSLYDLTLEDLMSLQVTSAAKSPTKLMNTAAAVYVITEEDIHRSGANNLPGLLRMVPGLQVVQLDSNRWAIAARGFNGQFSNKLLVMIDGRSVYTPTFSGVYWDMQDLALNEIERIEVIRGPGAALWGANAVNGIIHIITRPVKQTNGTQLVGWVGSEERAGLSAMQSNTITDSDDLRLVVKALQRDDSRFKSDDAKDDAKLGRVGFRWDRETEHYSLQTTGSYYQAREGANYARTFPIPPYVIEENEDTDLSGGYLTSHIKQNIGDNNTFEVKFYYDYTRRKELLYEEELHVVDIDFQHTINGSDRQRLTWGGGIRWYADELTGYHNLDLDHPQEQYALFNLFIQEDYPLNKEFTLTFGSKFEHNAFTGWEIQPNLRLLWHPTDHFSLWTALSRAVRTPSRIEDDGHVFASIHPPGSPDNPTMLPAVQLIEGSSDFESEELLAYELGARMIVTDNLMFDVALFLNSYDKFRSGELGRTEIISLDGVTPAYINQYITINNDLDGHSYGGECVIDWQVTRAWQLLTSYSYLELNINFNSPSEEELIGLYSRQLFSLQSRLDLGHGIEMDSWLTYNDEVGAQNIDDFWSLTLRLGWKPHPNWQLELIGQNLLEDQNQQLRSELPTMVSSEIERGTFFRVHYTY